MSRQVSSADVPIAKLTKDVLAGVWPLFMSGLYELPETAALICDDKVIAIQTQRQRIDELTTRFFLVVILKFKKRLGVELVTVVETTLPIGCDLNLNSVEQFQKSGFVVPEDEEKFRSAVAELEAYYELAVAEDRIFHEEEDLEDVPDEVAGESTDDDDSEDEPFT